MKTNIFLPAVLLALAFGQSHADIPRKINYQGKLTDASGKLVADGSFDMVFSIYDAATGGNRNGRRHGRPGARSGNERHFQRAAGSQPRSISL